ncbi:metallophosphoesterase [Paenibacillus sp. JJ-100]|uniref:metallophosphoesterase n=1 Tax=Paenibacillus sp. JJ-100 TaxID=2974896 RepID=UPI00232AAA73|nr:metallophosphoesterase [Paenibacillus sp. JJ-100]
MLAGAVMLLLHMWREAHTYVVSEDEVELVHLPTSFDGATILYLSDTHERLLKINDVEKFRGKVDWVLIGGDVAQEGISWSIVRQNMSLLSSLAPAFVVYGNHDKKAGTAYLSKLLENSNIQLLQDKSVFLHKGKEQVQLVGLDYRSKQGQLLFQKNREQGRRTKEGNSTIVLVHDPLDALRLDLDVDLVLSGHTHGGQMVLPLLGPIFLNKAYRAVSSGWFSLKRSMEDKRDGKMLVSRGYGTNHLPLRLCCPAEIHLITLRMPTAKSPDHL